MAEVEVYFDPYDYIDEITDEQLRAEMADRGLSSKMNQKDIESTLLEASEKLRKDGHIACAYKIDIILREEF